MGLNSSGDRIQQIGAGINIFDDNGDSYVSYTIDSSTPDTFGSNEVLFAFQVGGDANLNAYNNIVIDSSITLGRVRLYSYYYNEVIDNLTVSIPDGWTTVNTLNQVSPSNDIAGTDQINYNANVYDQYGNFRFELVITSQETVNVTNVCFTKGAKVRLANGQVKLVEQLKVGDLVETKDHGARPIRWIGSRKISSETLRQFPERRPVKISAGAIGNESDLILSQQHRVLVESVYADILYDEPEVLVAAKHLVNDSSIRVINDCTDVEYFHILFDEHELIYVDGMWSESFHPGRMSLESIGDDARNEVFCLFPELETDPEIAFSQARPDLKAREVALLRF